MIQVLTNNKLPTRGCPVFLEYKIIRISSQTLVQLIERINNAVMAIYEMMLQNICTYVVSPKGTHRTSVDCREKTWLVYGYFVASTIVISVIQYFGKYRVLKTNESFVVALYYILI